MRCIYRTILLVFLFSGLSGIAHSQVYELDNCGATGRTGPDSGDCNYGNFSVDIAGEGIQEWTVPEDGTYRITVAGAQGGEGDNLEGGLGAEIEGEFFLDSGNELRIVVGQKGRGGDQGAGGGGTYVVRKSSSGPYEMFDGQDVVPLIVAAGGKGQRNRGTIGGSASTTTDTSGGRSGGSSRGAGGGGFVGDGTDGGNEGGESFINGALGGSASRGFQGGFGGGGGSSDSFNGCGGGGGYSGGDGGNTNDDCTSDPAKSFSDGNNTQGTSAINQGHGYANIELLESDESDFCNFRGPVNECVMNQTNNLNSRQYNVSSIFESRSNAVFEAFNGAAKISIRNSSRVSGLWRGAFRIEAERPVLRTGAEFRPENGRIKIGK